MPNGRPTAPVLALVLCSLICTVGACSPRSSGADASADAAKPDGAALVEVEAGGLADVVDVQSAGVDVEVDVAETADVAPADVADVVDAGEVQDVAADAGDAATATDAGPADIGPNWYGIPYDAPCGKGPILPVKQADPTCKTKCPVPYPCVCGTCGWLPTPKMNLARLGHTAVWTGKWVVVAGRYQPFYDQLNQSLLTAERWNPAGQDAFLKVNLGAPVSNSNSYQASVSTIGGEVFIISYKCYRYNPETDATKEFACPGIYASRNWHAIAGKLIFASPNAAIFDPVTEKGEVLTVPQELFEAGGIPFASDCAASYGDNVYFYDAQVSNGKGKKWSNGVAYEDGAILVLHVPTMKWSLAVGKANPALRCTISGRTFVGQKDFDVANAYSKTSAGTLGGATSQWPTAAWGNVVSIDKTATEPPTTAQTSIDSGFLATDLTWLLPGSPGGASAFPGNPVFSSPHYFDRNQQTWHRLPPWGQAADGRMDAAFVLTDTEVIVLGGTNAWTVFDDGYRFPLAVINSGELP